MSYLCVEPKLYPFSNLIAGIVQEFLLSLFIYLKLSGLQKAYICKLKH